MHEIMIRNLTSQEIEANYDSFNQQQSKWALERLLLLSDVKDRQIESLEDDVRSMSYDLEEGCDECGEKEDEIEALEKKIEELEEGNKSGR